MSEMIRNRKNVVAYAGKNRNLLHTVSIFRRLLESSLFPFSRYDMSSSRDHPIYPDPARSV